MPTRFSPYAVLLVIGSCISLQFGAALAMQLFPVIGTWGVTVLRLGFAGLILLLITRPRFAGWTRRSWIAVGAFAVSLAGMNGTFYVAIERIPLSIGVAIEFLGPLVLAAALSRRRTDLIWIGLALAGMGVLAASSVLGLMNLDPIGVLFALLSAAFWAMYILAGTRVSTEVPGNSGLALAMLGGAALALPFGAGAIGPVFADPMLLLMMVGVAILASVVPYSLEFAALRRLPRHVFGVLLSLEPVAAAAAGFLVAGQPVSPAQWVTIALVVTASAGITLSAARARPRREPLPDVAAITAPIPLVAVPRRKRTRRREPVRR